MYADAPTAAAALRRVLQRTRRIVNKRDIAGRTPLHLCLDNPYLSYDGQREVALCLMTNGASGTIKDYKGKTPLDLYDYNECYYYENATRKKRRKNCGTYLKVCCIFSKYVDGTPDSYSRSS